MVVESAAVFHGDVVVDLGAVVGRDVFEFGGGELEQVDVAYVGVGAATVALLCGVVGQHSAVKGDVARVVVDAAAVFRGGVVVDEGVVSNDAAGVGIKAATFLGLVVCDLDLVVHFLAVDGDGALARVDAAAVFGGFVVGDLRLFAEDAARGFDVVLDVDVALVGVDAAAAVAGLVATVGVVRIVWVRVFFVVIITAVAV